jgi:hypothetical protein
MTIVEYAERGWHVAPFHTMKDGECDCQPYMKRKGLCRAGKHPRVRKTKLSKGGYHRATNDLAQVRAWAKRWPLMNVGLAMEPTHLIALDPDSRNGGDVVLAALEVELGPLPSTWRIQSGSGDVRYVFRLPPEVSLASGKIPRRERELEFIAGPGSGLLIAGTHKSGNPYIDLGGEVAEIPRAWLDVMVPFSPIPPKDYSLYVSGERKTEQGREPDPRELHAAQWLWGVLRLGEPFPAIRQPVRCLFHDDGKSPDSGFVVDAKGYMRFHCFHDKQTWGVTELYAGLVLKVEIPDMKALAKVRDRLYLASGAVERPVVLRDVLPDKVSADARLVYDDLVEALTANWVSFPRKPVMYMARYGASRLGLTKERVHRALRELNESAFIVVQDTAKLGAFTTNLYTTFAEAFKLEAETWAAIKSRGLEVTAYADAR